MARRTIPQTVSFQPDVWSFLEKQYNKSIVINQAVREYQQSRTTPEQKIKLLKQQKRDLIKKINILDDEIKHEKTKLSR